jgi:F-type H+-transporting ATPase subunit delta
MASVGYRYARALADVVFDTRLDSGQALAELQSLAALVAESGELRRVWENPALAAEEKRRLLDAMAARSGISRPVRNFMAVLIDHGRVPLLAQIARQFESEVVRRLNLAEAEIASARDLRDDEKRALESQIEKLTGKKVRARYRRDADLLGGVVIRMGSTIYDGSVLGQLNRMRGELVEV